MPKILQSVDAEQAAFDSTVKEIGEWWKTPKQAPIKRPYSAERIVSLRGLLPQKYASSEMAMKLWKQLREHQSNGAHEMTMGTGDRGIC